VLVALNLSRAGESRSTACFENPDDADVDACVAAVEAGREHVWGIAVNASHNACGRMDPREVVRRGLEAAQRTGLPLLYGMRRPEDWSFDEQMRQLRPGDVVTYCYRREPHCIIDRGRVHPAIRAARERGILFDVGHGMKSFDFKVAEAAIGDGFEPDTISTDLQRSHLSQVQHHNLPHTMSKLRAAGMPESNVFRAVTSRPAAILRRESEIGSLVPGSCADLTVLQWHSESVPLIDCHGMQRSGGYWEAVQVVRGGELLVLSTVRSHR
jgi:dihydroorotase